jgi:hypothetical protein
MFGMGMGMVWRQVAREEMDEVGSWLVGQSMRLAVETAGRFRDVPPILAASESMAFLMHALRREAFRAGEWRTWSTIFEPAMKQTIQLFATTLATWSEAQLDRETISRDVQYVVSSRSLEYQTVAFLSGPPSDSHTVVWAAARRLADATDPTRRDSVFAFVHQHCRHIVEQELPEQVGKLVKLLYGRRAA